MADSSCIVETSRTKGCAGLLKRKRARKLAKLLKSAKKHQHVCCRNVCENCTCLRKSHGSVVYDWFFPEIYELFLKFPAMNAGIDQGKSALPTRFMYYDKADWKPFSKDAIAILREHFRSRTNCFRLSVNGRTYLISLCQMMQMNLQTGYVRSVSWIDENAKAWLPSRFFEGHAARLALLLHKQMDHQCRVEADTRVTSSEICGTLQRTRESDIGHRESGLSMSMMDGSTCHSLISGSKQSLKAGGEVMAGLGCDFTLLGDKLIKLECGDEEYHVVVNKFLAGLGILSTCTSVVGIYRDTHSSASGHARLHAFQNQEDIIKKIRGDADVRYAWHGTSKHSVSGIILHGFGQPKCPKNGAAYGCGVYLAPECLSLVSAIYSDMDKNGEQHMILCRVIMGKMEQVPLGSQQFHPSSENYDTGVDDCVNPKRYIIWSTHMSTYILPEYVVSFKVATEWHDIMSALKGSHMMSRRIQAKDSLGALRKKLTNELSLPVSTTTEAEYTHKKVARLMSTCHSKVSDMPSGAGTENGRINRGPRSPWVSFPSLFYMLGLKLSPGDMRELQQCYDEFKAGRMPRESFIRSIRAVAGDHLLSESIKNMQERVQVPDESMASC